MFVSYRHPNGEARFYQSKEDALPEWATDIKEEAYQPNYAGLVPHPTDEYVHWSEKQPKEKMLQLRAAWEAIHAAGLGEQALFIIGEAVKTATAEEAYNHQDFS